jgi:hypothetical protein
MLIRSRDFPSPKGIALMATGIRPIRTLNELTRTLIVFMLTGIDPGVSGIVLMI